MRLVTKPVRLFEPMREAIRDHLLRLPLTDRYLRFCSAFSDDAVSAYVDRINLGIVSNDAVYGVLDSERGVAGIVHVAATEHDRSVEIALSVDEDIRKRGIGDMLFERGLLHCESIGARHIYMNCLSTNEAIKKMARRRNMSITNDYGESVASLDLNDANRTAAWLAEVQKDALALYDLRCLPMRQAWEDYVELVRSKHAAGRTESSQ